MAISLSYFLLKKINPGDFLFSQAVTHQVFSASKSLTAVFGMGTGVSSSSLSPEYYFIFVLLLYHISKVLSIMYLKNYITTLGQDLDLLVLVT